MSSTVPSETISPALPFALPRQHAGMADAARIMLALGMIALGILGLIYGDFAVQWQRIPIEHLPGRAMLAYVCAAVELMAGLGLTIRSTASISAGVLVIFVLLWAALLKLPAVVAVPTMEATWLGLGEITVILAGSWVLFVTHAGESGGQGLRYARWLFALSLPTIGLSHFIYLPQTLELVPGWLPFPTAWAYLTGAGNIAACLASCLAYGPDWPRCSKRPC